MKKSNFFLGLLVATLPLPIFFGWVTIPVVLVTTLLYVLAEHYQARDAKIDELSAILEQIIKDNKSVKDDLSSLQIKVGFRHGNK